MSYSLMDFDQLNKLYSIHSLVHSWTQTKVSDLDGIHQCSLVIAAMSVTRGQGATDYDFRQLLLKHINQLLDQSPSLLAGYATEFAYVYEDSGQLKKSEKLKYAAMAQRQQVLGTDHPDTLISIGNLALTYHQQGRLSEAEQLEVQVMESSQRVLGNDHPDTLLSIANLAATYHQQGHLSEAEELAIKVLEDRKRVLGDNHPETQASIRFLVELQGSM